MTFAPLATAAALTAVTTTTAFAEGLEVGGYLTPATSYSVTTFGSSTNASFDMELSAGYRSGPFYFGVLQFLNVRLEASGSDVLQLRQPVVMLGYDGLLVSYGAVEGAGNIFPEDYIGMSATSNRVDDTVRIDYGPGGDSAFLQHVALSYRTDRDDFHEAIDIGLRLALGDYDIGIGYQGSSERLGVIAARDFGDTRIHALAFTELDRNDRNEIGLSAYQMFGEVELGAHIELDADDLGDPLQAVGMMMHYETGIGTLTATIRHSPGTPQTLLRIGMNVPFGITAPYSEYHRDNARYTRRFGY